MATVGEKKILGLNGLRALAVVLVFIQHKTQWRTVWTSVDSGQVGVWIFFALSGFLIIGILNRQRQDDESGGNTYASALKRFFFRRAVRIFPIYYLVLALCALAYGAAIVTGNDAKAALFVGGWNGLLYHATYLSNIFMGMRLHDFAGMMSHLWSLAVEEQFYLVFAPLLLAIAARRHLAVCLACLGVGAATQFALRASQAEHVFTYTFTINNFAVMAAGGTCYFWARRTRFGAAQSTTLIALAVTLLLAAMFRDPLFGGSLTPAENGVLDVALILACAIIVMWVATNQQSAVTRALEWRPVEYLGRISYGFYLYHNFVPDLVQSKGFIHLSHLHPGSVTLKVVGLVVGFSVSVLAAHFSWCYIERPLLKLKQRYDRADLPLPVATPVRNHSSA